MSKIKKPPMSNEDRVNRIEQLELLMWGENTVDTDIIRGELNKVANTTNHALLNHEKDTLKLFLINFCKVKDDCKVKQTQIRTLIEIYNEVLPDALKEVIYNDIEDGHSIGVLVGSHNNVDVGHLNSGLILS